jgi:hypothetical protein
MPYGKYERCFLLTNAYSMGFIRFIVNYLVTFLFIILLFVYLFCKPISGQYINTFTIYSLTIYN